MNQKYIGFLALIVLVFAGFGFVSADLMGDNSVPAGFYKMSIYGGEMIQDGMRGYEFCQSKGFNEFCLIDRKIMTQQYTALNTGAQGVLARGFSGKPYLLYSNNEDGLLSCVNNLIQHQEKRDEESGIFTEVQDQIVCGERSQGNPGNEDQNIPQSFCGVTSCTLYEGSSALWADFTNDEYRLSLEYVSQDKAKLKVGDRTTSMLQPNDEWTFDDNRLLINSIGKEVDSFNNEFYKVEVEFSKNTDEVNSNSNANANVSIKKKGFFARLAGKIVSGFS